MQFQQSNFGHGTLSLEPGDHAILTDILDAWESREGGTDHVLLAETLEQFGYSTNGKLYPIMPVDVGGLTDAPMFTDDLEYLDDGSPNVRGKVWWYPQYESTSFMAQLLEKGQVTFTLAH